MSERIDIEETISKHEGLHEIKEVWSRKDMAAWAYYQMAKIFSEFGDDKLAKKSEAGPHGSEGVNWYTETTPFFEDSKGTRIAVQRYFPERVSWPRREGLLGALGIRRERVVETPTEHLSLVIGAGHVERREFLRVSNERKRIYELSGGLIRYSAGKPHQGCSGDNGSLKEDQEAIRILDAMEGAALLGETELWHGSGPVKVA